MRFVMVGCGQLPVTAIHVLERASCENVTCMDVVERAITASERLKAVFGWPALNPLHCDGSVFDFGAGGGFGGRMGFGPPRDAPTLFYSRRIGLDGGEVVPIRAGGRLTGKVGAFGIGAMNIQTGGVPEAGVDGNNFSVLRVKRDLFARSSIGVLATNRTHAVGGGGSAQSYGGDAQLAFFENLELGAYYATTETPGLTGDDESFEGRVDWNGDRYGAGVSFLKVGADFNPEVGFVRRRDFTKSSADVRFSPRPASIDAIRQLTWSARVDYFEDGLGQTESRVQNGRFQVDLENSDQVTFRTTRNFERIDRAFDVNSELTVLPGQYTFTDFQLQYNFGPQRRLSGNVSVNWGNFYDGSLTSVGVNQGRVVITDRLSLEPGVSVNFIELPDQPSSTQTVSRLRADYAFTARMFASALVQHNSDSNTFSSNLRFRWEYQPGSELFFVWTDERDTGPGGTGLRNRALILKITRLLRY